MIADYYLIFSVCDFALACFSSVNFNTPFCTSALDLLISIAGTLNRRSMCRLCRSFSSRFALIDKMSSLYSIAISDFSKPGTSISN